MLKTGVDDFLAAGHTIAELKALSRKFEPADAGRIRMGRDDKLRARLEDLDRRLRDFGWQGMGGHSARDVYAKLLESAARHGKIHPDGLRVRKAQGPLAIEAKVSGRTLWKALNRLEEWGLLYRDNGGRKPDKSGAFVLRANVSHKGGQDDQQGQATSPLHACDPGDLHLRAPRLRWSRPKWKPGKETRRKFRRGEIQRLPEPRDRIDRLGKIRGAIIDALERAGRPMGLDELAAVLHRKRPRDVRRRNLPMLEEAGIIAVAGDVVSLAPDWPEKLEEARRLGQEFEADEIARERHRIKREAYRNRGKTEPTPHWTNHPEADGAVEDLRRRADEPAGEQEAGQEPELSPLAAAIRDYLDRRPHDADQPPGWIGVTLWAEGLHPKLENSAAEVKAAIEELGGEEYLRERLRASRGAAA